MKYKIRVKDITLVAFFAALISVMSYVSVPLPFSPVPVTGQTLAIMLAGTVLTVSQSAMSVFVYLLLGAIGLPVFSGGGSGIGTIVGPTGGYLIGFLIGAAVIALLKGRKNSFLRLIVANLTGGIVVVYSIGMPWLSLATHMGMAKAFTLGVLPFLPGDILKLVIVIVAGYKINQILDKQNLR